MIMTIIRHVQSFVSDPNKLQPSFGGTFHLGRGLHANEENEDRQVNRRDWNGERVTGNVFVSVYNLNSSALCENRRNKR